MRRVNPIPLRSSPGSSLGESRRFSVRAAQRPLPLRIIAECCVRTRRDPAPRPAAGPVLTAMVLSRDPKRKARTGRTGKVDLCLPYFKQLASLERQATERLQQEESGRATGPGSPAATETG